MSSGGRVWWATAAAVTVALAGCGGTGGGSGGGDHASAVKHVVEQFQKTEDCALLTKAERVELSGESSVSGCEKAMAEKDKPDFTIESAAVTGSRGAVKVHGSEGDYTIHLVDANGAWLIDHVDEPAGAGGDTTPTSAAPADTTSALRAPIADATAARDALLQVARTASYAPNPSDPYAVDAVFRAWQASAPGLQLGNSVSAATPTRLSSSGDFVTDKASGDSVLWFTVTDTSKHCAAGAVALSATAGPNDPPTIFVPIDTTNLSSCSASALIDVGMPSSTH